MKKVIIADFMEYDDPSNKLGNYHYAKCFSKDNYEVLWMSCLWNNLFYFKDKEIYKKRKKLSKPDRTKNRLDENIYGFAPYSIRLYGNYLFSKSENIVLNNHKYIRPDIKKSLKLMGFDKVSVLWISNPKQYWLTEVVEYDKLIFRIPDDFTEFGVFPKSIVDIENKLIDKADYIFVTDKKLGVKARRRGKNYYFLPNGTEFHHFQNKLNKPKEYEDDKPKIVYIGAIGNWFDEELVAYIAEKLDVNVYIIGSMTREFPKLRSFRNVYIMGAKPYDEIPAYLQHGDVAIIPFIKNKFTDTINPIKLFEYCSTGIGVVSTNLKGVEEMNAPVYVAKNYDDFIKGIEFYINNRYEKEKIVEFAKNNTWKARYKTIKKYL